MKTKTDLAHEYALSEHHTTGHYSDIQIEEIKEFAYMQGWEDSQRWIPVEDELPEIGVEVLCKVVRSRDEEIRNFIQSSECVDDYYHAKDKCPFRIEHLQNEYRISTIVTHWRPIELK